MKNMRPEKLPSILLVGCGNMGEAMLSEWVKHGVEHVVVVRRRGLPITWAGQRVTVCTDVSGVPTWFSPDVIILATKPQQAELVIPDYIRWAASGTPVLSIMAGKTVANIGAVFGAGVPVVRAMPNTPATVGHGFTCAFAGPGVTAEQLQLCDELLSAIGEVVWVEDEDFIDPITAVSGGGPAYIFLLAELLEAAAIEQGLPPSLARRMVRCTVEGAGVLLFNSKLDAAELRKNVTSPRGTTESALSILMAQSAWPRLVSEAVAAATSRSRELAGVQSH